MAFVQGTTGLAPTALAPRGTEGAGGTARPGLDHGGGLVPQTAREGAKGIARVLCFRMHGVISQLS